jgi:hypothetical protein
VTRTAEAHKGPSAGDGKLIPLTSNEIRRLFTKLTQTRDTRAGVRPQGMSEMVPGRPRQAVKPGAGRIRPDAVAADSDPYRPVMRCMR